MHIFKLCVCALECDMHKFRSNVCLCAEVISLSVCILSNLVCVYAFFFFFFFTATTSIKQF